MCVYGGEWEAVSGEEVSEKVGGVQPGCWWDCKRNRREKESRSLTRDLLSLTRDLLLIANISKWGFKSEK